MFDYIYVILNLLLLHNRYIEHTIHCPYMETKQTFFLVLIAMSLFSIPAISATVSASSSIDEEEEEEPATVTPPAELASTVPAAPATATAPPAAGEDFVRARVMLFGVPPNSPNIVSWVNVPGANATSADTITATELDATNNVTGDGIGELFISLPNTTAQINQQVQACALDVVSQVPQCDNAFVAATNSSTMLQILLGNAAAAAPQ